jgi:tetratricopeptide (TPR) repeat protein
MLPFHQAFSQATWFFTFSGRVEHTDEKGKDVALEGAICTLTKGGSVVNSVTTGGNGKFSFQLDPNADFVVSFTKPGFITKRFAVSTKNVPDDRAQHGFGKWDIEVVIFEQYPGLDYSVTDKPIAKVVFDPSKEVDDFSFDQAYTAQMQGALDKLKQLADAAKKKDKDYAAAMSAGDKAFGNKDWAGAKAQYQAASAIKPTETAPKDKMKDCDTNIAADAQKGKADADYKAAMTAGDQAFGAKSWDAAKAAYQKALGLKPGDGPATQKLKDVDAAIAADKAKGQLEADYKTAMDAGDKAFGAKTWDAAKTAYQKALDLKPKDGSATQKLKDVDAAIAADKAKGQLEADYKTAMDAGDKAFGTKTWDAAKTSYNKALSLKPNDPPATQKLKDIDAAIAADKDAKAKDAQYAAAIKKGDDAFNAKKWDDAKAAYTDASTLKPSEQYPKDKLKAIADAIAADKAKGQLEADYKAAMDAGDKAFGAKTWDAAKTSYNKALTLKPNDPPATQKLKDIDAAIAAEKDAKAKGQLEADYKAAMDAGDKAFGAKTWDAAKTSYNKALTLKPNDPPATQKLKDIDAAIAAEKDAKAKGQLEADYKAAMDAGDKAFGAKTWDAAKTSYQKALTLKPNDPPATQKLKDIDAAIAAEKDAKAKDAQYAAAIKKGDDAFKAKDYPTAKSGYNDALALKSGEAYPKAQLKAIDDLLAKDAKDKDLNDKYNAAIKKGDDAFKAKDYPTAKGGYNDALALKATEAYPKAQLKAIDDLLAKDAKDKDLNDKYNAAIKKGDDAFGAKDYPTAKAGYTDASTLKPTEQYPKDKLKAIADIMAKADADKANKAKYDAAIAKADKAMNAKDYVNAKAGYNEALTYKSDEQYPKDKLKELEDLLAKDKDAKDKNSKYQAALKKGDDAFKAKKYDDAKAGYTDASGIKPDEAYPKAQLKAIDDLLAADSKNKELDAKYQTAIKKGDDAFKAKDYPTAKGAYNDALALKSGEAYPKTQLKAIDDLLAKDSKDKELNEKYQTAIKKGDDAFTAKDYTTAKAGYTDASTLKPTEQYPKDKLKAIADIMAKADGDKANKAKYDAAIAKADKAMAAKDYVNAKTGYNEALTYKSDEQYPKDKLKELEDLLAKDKDAKDKNAKYQAALKKGDDAFKAKKYDDAKAGYTDASGIKPDEAYPKAQLKAIEDLLAADSKNKELDAKYQAAIKKGDDAFKAKDYPTAKGGYNDALALKPAEAYPKAQLKAIDDLLNKDNTANSKYQAAIKKGDDAFGTKDYSTAKTAYTEASGIKPAEQYPKDKLKAIADILDKENKDKGLKAKYDAAIKKGDDAFAAKTYPAAKAAYTEATGLKSDEQYPKDKLKELDNLMKDAEDQKSKNARYTAAITKADIAFKAKKWDDAKAGYNEALGVKPDEEYPQSRLKEIEEAIARDKANQDVNGRYNNAIVRGDEALKANDYTKAKPAYEEALGIKPTEVYPKTKLDFIASMLAKDEKNKEIMEKYKKAMQDGDNAMAKEDYVAAKAAYTEATQLRPDQMTPKDQLNQINALLLGKAKRDAKYKDAIARGDKAFGAKDYTTARAAYVEASETKPAEAYPKQKIKDCDTFLNKITPKNTVVTEVETPQSRRNKLAQQYGEGMTELPESQEVNCKVVTRIVVHGAEGFRYTQKTYSYGGVYYFKDDESISKVDFDRETAPH